jgi:hypothetical protein
MLMGLALFTAATARAGLSYLYVITVPPDWADFGSPQPVLATFCTAVNLPAANKTSACGGGNGMFSYENYETLSFPGSATYYAGDTFKGEANGLIGADISVPTAQWVAPAVYTWTAGVGGGIAFFNSYSGGVYYANELMVLDPPSFPVYSDLELFAGELGALGPLPLPNTNYSPNAHGYVNVPDPTEGFLPEPSFYAPLAFGFLFLGMRLWARKRAEG